MFYVVLKSSWSVDLLILVETLYLVSGYLPYPLVPCSLLVQYLQKNIVHLCYCVDASQCLNSHNYKRTWEYLATKLANVYPWLISNGRFGLALEKKNASPDWSGFPNIQVHVQEQLTGRPGCVLDLTISDETSYTVYQTQCRHQEALQIMGFVGISYGMLTNQTFFSTGRLCIVFVVTCHTHLLNELHVCCIYDCIHECFPTL